MKNVGKVIRVEWDQETDEVRIVIEILDNNFKKRAIHNKDFSDILKIIKKDAMVIKE